MKRLILAGSLLAVLCVTAFALDDDGIPFRRMDYYCWEAFAQVVPAKVDTVLLIVGSLEAHGALASGADTLVPERLAEMIAPKANALIAPGIPYGISPSLSSYPGCVTISDEALKAICTEVVAGLADCGFRNIIILNGHGGNRACLNAVALDVSPRKKVRIMVVDWWSYCADLTQEIWGPDEDGGHAGLNENAAVHAVDPRFVDKRFYRESLAVPINSAITTYPNPGSILLYSEGKGYPDFDREKAVRYLNRVAEELTKLIVETRALWDEAGLYR
ncbi:MAG TPA: creatininase family protein [Acidobacteriota bacterium]|nr:creatininase family protein [Acidobacteriota bacterium]